MSFSVFIRVDPYITYRRKLRLVSFEETLKNLLVLTFDFGLFRKS